MTFARSSALDSWWVRDAIAIRSRSGNDVFVGTSRALREKSVFQLFFERLVSAISNRISDGGVTAALSTNVFPQLAAKHLG